MKRLLECVGVLTMLFGMLPANADIIVDGVNHGLSYSLVGKADSVSIDSGVLTIGNHGMVMGDLRILGGEVAIEQGAGNVKGVSLQGGRLTVSGGNIHHPVVYAGKLTLDGDAKILGGLSLLGGTTMVTQVDKVNGGIAMNNDATLFMMDLDVCGLISVQDNAIAYFAEGYLTDSMVNPEGNVVDTPNGSITGNGGALEFSVDSGAALYVGVIPEPATLALIMLAGGGMVIVRRFNTGGRRIQL